MITNAQIDEACKAARDRYAAKDFSAASLDFSFELQGYMAVALEVQRMTFDEATAKIDALIAMLRKANDI